MVKRFQSRTQVGRFVKLDETNWKHGNPSDVLCGGHFRQPDDFISLISGDINSVFTPNLPRVNVPE